MTGRTSRALAVDVPGVQVVVAEAVYSIAATVWSLRPPSGLQFPSAGTLRMASATHAEPGKRDSVAPSQVVATEHAVQAVHWTVAPSSTVNALVKGVPAGQATEPLRTMHAEKPAGAAPPQTASALAVGTSQYRAAGSVSWVGSLWAVPEVHAPP